MMVGDRRHENAACAEKLLVLGLKVDRKTGQLLIVEEAAHSGHAPTTHEVGPLQDAIQRRVRRPCSVHCLLAAPRRPKVEVRIHFLHPAWPTERPASHPRPVITLLAVGCSVIRPRHKTPKNRSGTVLSSIQPV